MAVLARPNESYSITVRLQIDNKPGMLGQVTSAIGRAGGDIGAVDIVEVVGQTMIRDVTLKAGSGTHSAGDCRRGYAVSTASRSSTSSDRTFLMHLGGKIEVVSEDAAQDARRSFDGVHDRASHACAWRSTRPGKVFQTAPSRRTRWPSCPTAPRCLVSATSARAAAMPVMEGKAMLFKEFGGVDAFPICLNTKDPDEIVETLVRLAPFGGINLEDISAPRCFEIEERLKKSSTSRSFTTTSTAPRWSCWPR